MKRIIQNITILIGGLLILNIVIALIFYPFEKTLRVNFGSVGLSEDKIKTIGIENKSEFRNFLYLNYIGMYYDYDNFVGWKERSIKSKYFNVDINGRNVLNRPTDCNKNIYIYGSSITFGYLSKDSNTIASFLQKILIENNFDNICVYNQGRANFSSYRENMLLIKDLTNKKIETNDFAIFMDGPSELLPSSLISKIEENMMYQSNNFYYNFLYSLKNIFETSPIARFYNIISSRLEGGKNKYKIFDQNKIDSLINHKKNLFLKNLKIRQSLCKNFELNCITFILPNGYAREENEDVQVRNNNNIFFGRNLKKFEHKIKNTQGTTDISDIFDNTTKTIYIDDIHLSPYASNVVARNIFISIKNLIK